jgi:uncharacterized membrane protein
MLWPYLAGGVVLALGLIAIFRGEWAGAGGLDRAVLLGRLAFAVPLAMFGGEHFLAATAIASMIPHWIPGHLFWSYFVGVALMAAGLSIAVKKLSGVAATLLGIMIFCFVVLLHVPRLLANPGDREALIVVVRDLGFSFGALAYAATQGLSKTVATAARLVIALMMIVFGAEHFAHPDVVPVVPLSLAMPGWVPAHRVLAYGVGIVLLLGGLCVAVNWKARWVAAWLGVVVFAVVMTIYLPILLANPADIGTGMNYFADTLLVSGTFFMLAGSMPEVSGFRDRREEYRTGSQSFAGVRR